MHRTIIAALLLIAALAMLCCAPGAAKPTKEEAKTLILPGDAVGAFQLGMTLDEVKKIAGAPHVERGSDGTVMWTYRISGGKDKVFRFSFEAMEKSRVVIGIMTDMPVYRTKDGIGVDSRLDDIRRRLGEPDRITQLESGSMGVDYAKLGIGFLVSNKSSKVTMVRVVVPSEK